MLISLNEVLVQTGLKRTTVYELLKEGKFPEPENMGVCHKMWDVACINAWIKGCRVGCSCGTKSPRLSR